MGSMDIGREGSRLLPEKLKSNPPFFGHGFAALPDIVGSNRTLDLSAGGEILCDDGVRETFGLEGIGDGGPSDEHGRASKGRRVGGARAILGWGKRPRTVAVWKAGEPVKGSS